MPSLFGLNMSEEFVDFRLTQDYSNNQLLTFAKDPAYPSYHIKIHNSGSLVLPSLLHLTPDVSISHQNYLASSFADATFHRYRSSIGVNYPETSLRTPNGDVTTSVERLLPKHHQKIQCESLAERRFTLSLDVDSDNSESFSWCPPSTDRDRVHFLELKQKDRTGEDGAIAKVLLKSWGDVAREELIAVIRVREDILDKQEDVRQADQIFVTAVVLVERLRRKHRSLRGYNGAMFV